MRHKLFMGPVLCPDAVQWRQGQALATLLLPPYTFQCEDLSTYGFFHPPGRQEHGGKTKAWLEDKSMVGRQEHVMGEGKEPNLLNNTVMFPKQFWSAITNAWIWAIVNDFPGCEGEGLERQLNKIICVILLKANICLMLMAFKGSTEVILMEL